jgi:hypothetical protein
MKINSSLIAALALAAATAANAQNFVYITGSTAARAVVFGALSSTTASGHGIWDGTPTVVGYGNTTASKASFLWISNTIATVPTILKAHWSGSEAGISDTTGLTQEQFPDDSDSTVTSTAPGTTASIAGNPATLTPLTTVDLAMADNAVAFSKNPSSIVGNSTNNSFVGVIPFVFVKNFCTLPGATNISNITDAQFKRLILNGGDKIALVSGVATDTTNFVYIAGRDDNSGTRVNTLGITSVGIGNGAVEQIELSGGAMVQDPVSGNFAANFGQSSGGTLATSMTVNTASSTDQVNGGTGFAVIAYLGIDDANSAIGAATPASIITYNGVTESATTVEQGEYGLWGNEFLLKNAAAAAPARALFTTLKTAIPANEDGLRLFSTTSMHATRGGPTSVPAHK